MQTNDLIFSTQNIKSKPQWGIWVTAIILPITTFLVVPLLWASMIVGIEIAFFMFGFAKINKTSKSYIALYSNKIIGIDISGVSFEIQYSEIARCDFQTDSVRICWHGGYYTVRTPNCEQKVINIIKQQQTINAQQ